MNEVIDKLQEELGIEFYYISRDEGKVPCVVYNYKKELNISDMQKESASYDFYFILIITRFLKLLTKLWASLSAICVSMVLKTSCV